MLIRMGFPHSSTGLAGGAGALDIAAAVRSAGALPQVWHPAASWAQSEASSARGSLASTGIAQSASATINVERAGHEARGVGLGKRMT